MTVATAARAFPRPSIRRNVWAPPSRSVSTRRAARSSLVTGVVVAVLAYLGLAVAVETVRPEWRDPEFFTRLNRLRTIANSEAQGSHLRPVIVVLGGSRTQRGLSPEHLGLGTGPADPLVFNCAQSGCLPVGLRLNLARLLATGYSPDRVLIEVLPPVLADPGPMEDRIPAPRLGYVDLARLRPYHTDPARARRAWLQARATSWYTLRLPLMASWGLADALPPGPERPDVLWAGMHPDGWAPLYPRKWSAESRTRPLQVARQSYEYLLNDFRVEPVNDRAFRDAMTDCRDRNIRAALFVMPESPTFRGWYPPVARKRVCEYLAGLARDFGVPVFDASGWTDDESAFTDGHHLLGEAAEAFSQWFGWKYVGPWVRGE